VRTGEGDLRTTQLHPTARRGQRRRTGEDLERPQGRVRRRRPHQPRLLRTGRRRTPHPAGRGAGSHRGHGPDRRTARGQRLPRGRREPAPPGAVRRGRRGTGTRRKTGEADRGTLCRTGRLALRRTRHRHRQGVVDAAHGPRRRPRHAGPRPLGVRPGPAVQPGPAPAHAVTVRRSARPLPPTRAGGGWSDRTAMTAATSTPSTPPTVLAPADLREAHEALADTHGPVDIRGSGTATHWADP